MDVAAALRFIHDAKEPGVLATLQPDGRPHCSVVTGTVVGGQLWISATQSRIKTRNVRLDPRVTFTAGIRPWVAIEGTASIRDGDGVLDDLRRYYRTARGEHPDWGEYDATMVRDGRLIIAIEPARAYGFGLGS